MMLREASSVNSLVLQESGILGAGILFLRLFFLDMVSTDVAKNSSSCLHLPSAEIVGIYCHTWIAHRSKE